MPDTLPGIGNTTVTTGDNDPSAYVIVKERDNKQAINTIGCQKVIKSLEKRGHLGGPVG